MMVATSSIRPTDGWQSTIKTNLPISSTHTSSQVWGRSLSGYFISKRSMGVLHSTAAPSSSSSETFPDEDSNNHKSEASEVNSKPANSKQVILEKFPQHTKRSPVDRLSMPWSEVQDWALRDNLPKYTIVIPLEVPNKSGHFGSAEDDDDEGAAATAGTLVFALWRTMLKEVPELAGYPLDFLQEVHSKQISNNDTKMQVTPGLLPYLEDYTFASAGGVSGNVYGVPGLADGTRIETSAVTNIEVTLPQGFVRTSDGKAAYELGRPQRQEFLNGATGDKLNLAARTSLGVARSGSYELLQTIKSAAPDTVEDADGMLLRLGASTGILLAGATAINMLSHHLTVNVFWV